MAQNVSDVRTDRRLYHVNQHFVMQAEVSEASSGNPGIPPSSLMSFLRVKHAISGEVPLRTLEQGCCGATTTNSGGVHLQSQAALAQHI